MSEYDGVFYCRGEVLKHRDAPLIDFVADGPEDRGSLVVERTQLRFQGKHDELTIAANEIKAVFVAKPEDDDEYFFSYPYGATASSHKSARLENLERRRWVVVVVATPGDELYDTAALFYLKRKLIRGERKLVNELKELASAE